MKLSADSFRALTQALTGTNLSLPTERRRSARVPVKMRVPLSIIQNGEPQPAVPIMVQDISPRGINIHYPENLPVGQQFAVQLLEGPDKIALLCRVMHSQLLDTGLHSIGAEFTCVLPVRPQTAADFRTQQSIRESLLDS